MRTHFLIRLSPFAVFAATALVAACNSSPTDPGPGDTRTFLLVIKPSTATLQPNHQLQLQVLAQGAEDRVRSNTDVVWSSTDERVATVTADGVVTAKGNGAVQITAWWEGHRGLATVKVVEQSVRGPCDHLPIVPAKPNLAKASTCEEPAPKP
jgi:Bacterial Ig-like domain (group 2)